MCTIIVDGYPICGCFNYYLLCMTTWTIQKQKNFALARKTKALDGFMKLLVKVLRMFSHRHRMENKHIIVWICF